MKPSHAMPDILENITLVRQRLADSAARSGRSSSDLCLLAVSKTRSAAEIRLAHRAGLQAFGENYLQEALDKMDQLQDLDLSWHFIGPLQSNKTKAVAERFDWVHSVDRLKIARRLSEQRPEHLPPLHICLQVNIDDEHSKSGVAPAAAAELALAVAELPRLRLRGLMAIPKPQPLPAQQRRSFFRLRQLLDTLTTLSPTLAAMDTLSMGMSADLDAAIAEGSTIVRVGTALFGPRNPGQTGDADPVHNPSH